MVASLNILFFENFLNLRKGKKFILIVLYHSNYVDFQENICGQTGNFYSFKRQIYYLLMLSILHMVDILAMYSCLSAELILLVQWHSCCLYLSTSVLKTDMVKESSRNEGEHQSWTKKGKFVGNNSLKKIGSKMQTKRHSHEGCFIIWLLISPKWPTKSAKEQIGFIQ